MDKGVWTVDALSLVLDSVRFKGEFYFTTEFKAPWGIEVPSFEKVARFHYLYSGSCWVRIDGEPPILLNAGDFIIIPHGITHVLCDQPDRDATALEKIIEETAYPGHGVFAYGPDKSDKRGNLVCGHFEFDYKIDHPLLTNLPKYILIKEQYAVDRSWLKDALRLLAYEARENRAGSHAGVNRLSEIIFIQVLRLWSELHPDLPGFLSAVSDPKLARPLGEFHSQISGHWTIDKLASIAGMSRTSFAEKFREVMQMPPMQYITEWRMQNAQRLLTDTLMSTDMIATQVGYESGAAFSKAFKRVTGSNPGEFRRVSGE